MTESAGLPDHLNPKGYSDAQLIRNCADCLEDDASWVEFVSRYDPILNRSVCRAYRRFTQGGYPPRWRVAELVQDVYLRLLKNDCELLRRLRGETGSAAKAYFAQVAAHTTGDLLRQELAQKRIHVSTSLDESRPPEQSLVDSFALPERLADRDLIKLLARHSAGEQVQRDAMIFLLHVRAGLTAEEIARADFVRLQPASVMSILIRTRNRLKKALMKAA
ncbi:MAG: hypothetical protein ABI882_18185 [Acidobacteriota bacterium]